MGLLAMQIDKPELKLRFDVSGFGRPPIPDHRIGEAVHYAFTAGVKLPNPGRCFRLSQRVRPPPIIQRLQVPLALVSFDSASKYPAALAAGFGFCPGPRASPVTLTAPASTGRCRAAKPLSRYAATERVPMFMSALNVIPGISRKFSGTLRKFTVSIAAARLVIGLDRLSIVVSGKSAFADPAHFAFGRAVLDEIERIDLEHAAIAAPQKSDVARSNAQIGFQRRIRRHQREQRVAFLEHRADRELGLASDTTESSVRRQANQILMLVGLFQLRIGGIECAASGHQILAQSAEPLLLERLAIGLQRRERSAATSSRNCDRIPDVRSTSMC